MDSRPRMIDPPWETCSLPRAKYFFGGLRGLDGLRHCPPAAPRSRCSQVGSQLHPGEIQCLGSLVGLIKLTVLREGNREHRDPVASECRADCSQTSVRVQPAARDRGPSDLDVSPISVHQLRGELWPGNSSRTSSCSSESFDVASAGGIS